MNERYERRVKRLRDHVLQNQAIETEDGMIDDIVETIYEDIEQAHEQAIAEDEARELDKLTIAELKALLDQQEVKYSSKVKKDELIKLIEGAE